MAIKQCNNNLQLLYKSHNSYNAFFNDYGNKIYSLPWFRILDNTGMLIVSQDRSKVVLLREKSFGNVVIHYFVAQSLIRRLSLSYN